MKKLFSLALVIIFVLGIGIGLAVAGNDAPNGAHYNLNLLGKEWEDHEPMDCSSGNRIFVKLYGKTKIMLALGEDFQVMDCDGASDGEAMFALPDPFEYGVMCDANNNCVREVEYVIYARALAKPCKDDDPNCFAFMKTCASDPNGDLQCSMEVLELARTKRPKFVNVTKELTTILVDFDGDGVADTRVGLFDDDWEGFFWEYDNHGLRLLQLRFFLVEDESIPWDL